MDDVVIPSIRLSKDTVAASNLLVSRAFNLGNKPITEIKAIPVISADDGYQEGNSLGNVLAAISGIEAFYNYADEAPITRIIMELSQGISEDNGIKTLDKNIQDKIVMGINKVAADRNASAQKSLTKLIDYQNKFTQSDLVVPPTVISHKKPVFINASKTSNLKPKRQLPC